jgi:hypothetical protein
VTARPDTGHPFGLLRCLVHDDGHVAMSATGKELVPKVEAMHALLAELGMAGWRLAWLAAEDAAAAYLGGLGCARCAMRLSCGCDITQDVLRGRCPHGSAKRFYNAATRTGYRDVGPHPPGGDPQAPDQAELDSYATQLADTFAEIGRLQDRADRAGSQRRDPRERPGRRRKRRGR